MWANNVVLGSPLFQALLLQMRISGNHSMFKKLDGQLNATRSITVSPILHWTSHSQAWPLAYNKGDGRTLVQINVDVLDSSALRLRWSIGKILFTFYLNQFCQTGAGDVRIESIVSFVPWLAVWHSRASSRGLRNWHKKAFFLVDAMFIL